MLTSAWSAAQQSGSLVVKIRHVYHLRAPPPLHSTKKHACSQPISSPPCPFSTPWPRCVALAVQCHLLPIRKQQLCASHSVPNYPLESSGGRHGAPHAPPANPLNVFPFPFPPVPKRPRRTLGGPYPTTSQGMEKRGWALWKWWCAHLKENI